VRATSHGIDPLRGALLPHDLARRLGRRYDDDGYLAPFLRLYLAADAAWPASVELPRSLSGEAEHAMIATRAIAYDGPGRFRVPMVDELKMRQRKGRAIGGHASAAKLDAQGRRGPSGRFTREPAKPANGTGKVHRQRTGNDRQRPATEPANRLNTNLKVGDAGPSGAAIDGAAAGRPTDNARAFIEAKRSECIRCGRPIAGEPHEAVRTEAGIRLRHVGCLEAEAQPSGQYAATNGPPAGGENAEDGPDLVAEARRVFGDDILDDPVTPWDTSAMVPRRASA
jgi:hypothetical protein